MRPLYLAKQPGLNLNLSVNSADSGLPGCRFAKTSTERLTTLVISITNLWQNRLVGDYRIWQAISHRVLQCVSGDNARNIMILRPVSWATDTIMKSSQSLSGSPMGFVWYLYCVWRWGKYPSWQVVLFLDWRNQPNIWYLVQSTSFQFHGHIASKFWGTCGVKNGVMSKCLTFRH